MSKRYIHRILGSVVSLSLLVSCLGGMNSAADNKYEEATEIEIIEKDECLKETIDYKSLDFYVEDNPDSTYNINASSLPSSVDLSETPYFPPIANQNNLGSCVAFATTYYQFSYEVNKLRGITSKEDQVIYSPKWTYNNINGGANKGSQITDAYTLLNNFGALKYDDLPYDNDYWTIPGNRLSSNNEMIDERLEALKIRLSSYSSIELPTVGTFITSPNDNDLYAIKEKLNSGKILVVSTCNGFNTMKGYGQYSNLNICYRSYQADGHAMAVVGYDDNVCCDVNGNGTIEPYEKGAFKIANSHGLSGGSTDTNGYRWVLYDAINKESANKINSWEDSLYGYRVQALCHAANSPCFWYINVANKDVDFVGELDIKLDDYYKLGLRIGRSAGNLSSANNYSNSIKPIHPKTPTKYEGVILFDYDSYCNPITTYMYDYKWYVKLSGTSYTSKFRIVDDLEQPLTEYDSYDSNDVKSRATYLRMGDIDYNGAVSLNDSVMIQNWLLKKIAFSHLQSVVADVNGDGIINMADSLWIRTHMDGFDHDSIVDDPLFDYLYNFDGVSLS